MGQRGEQLANTGFQFARNLYWRSGGRPFTLAGATWEAWQRRGQDAGSVVADPLLLEPAAGLFDLAFESPASRIAFKTVDLAAVGPCANFAANLGQ